MTTFDKVYAAVRLIPRGSVATYGQIAEAIGNKRLARVVGYALHVNPEPGVIPCHRVVKRDGEPMLQIAIPCRRLMAEFQCRKMRMDRTIRSCMF